MLAVLAVGLDGTVLSVALPTLASALHASETDLQWFSSGYLLVLAAVMLPAGLLGDRIGRKRVMVGALLLFAVASAGCAVSRTPAEFIAARVALGIAGAPLIVMAISALAVLFTEEERPRAVGIWASVNFLALPIGPILGGYLLTHAWWGWVFLMNVPVALLGLLAVAFLVPESRAPETPGLDPVGVLTSAVGLVGLTYGLIEAGEYGWGTVNAIVPMVVGIALLAAFFPWEGALQRRGGKTLVDLELFRARSFTGGILILAVATVTMVGALFTLPQYFQGIVGTDPMGSGIRLLPMIGGLILGALPSDRVTARFGPRRTIAAGFAVIGTALLLGATTTLGTGGGFTALWVAVLGLGMGLVFAPTASAALSQLSAERSGVGSGALQALTKVGGPLGAAVFGSALTTVYLAQVPIAGLPATLATAMKSSLVGGLGVARGLGSATLAHGVRIAFVHGMDAALLASVGFAVLGIVLAVVLMPARLPRSAAGTVAATDRPAAAGAAAAEVPRVQPVVATATIASSAGERPR
jgi:EmrB/QacA subfamily drug resistance transporter